jgi:hypothetical protein
MNKKPIGAPPGPRPLSWKYPHDRIRTDKHRGYLRARAQWNFRGEGCEMTTEEWQTIWRDDIWLNRGRLPEQYCLIRDDPKEPWHIKNVMLVTRRLQLIIQKHVPEMYQMSNGVWDITGESLKKWQQGIGQRAKYKDRYKHNQLTPKERGF